MAGIPYGTLITLGALGVGGFVLWTQKDAIMGAISSATQQLTGALGGGAPAAAAAPAPGAAAPTKPGDPFTPNPQQQTMPPGFMPPDQGGAAGGVQYPNLQTAYPESFNPTAPVGQGQPGVPLPPLPRSYDPNVGMQYAQTYGGPVYPITSGSQIDPNTGLPVPYSSYGQQGIIDPLTGRPVLNPASLYGGGIAQPDPYSLYNTGGGLSPYGPTPQSFGTYGGLPSTPYDPFGLGYAPTGAQTLAQQTQQALQPYQPQQQQQLPPQYQPLPPQQQYPLPLPPQYVPQQQPLPPPPQYPYTTGGADPAVCKSKYNGSCNTECSAADKSKCLPCQIACGVYQSRYASSSTKHSNYAYDVKQNGQGILIM